MKVPLAIVIAASLAWQMPALAQNSPPPPAAIVLPELQEADLGLWVAKNNAYVGLLNGSTRAIDSLNRYKSWVDIKTGPTGKERYITYGLYSVDPGLAKSAITKARAAASEPPAFPALDATAQEYAASFETLVPILNDAAAYYERLDYKDDKMAGGRELHAKIVPAMAAFLAARHRFEEAQEILSTGLQRQELVVIERREGKSLRWQVGHVAITAKAALHALPRDPQTADVTAFSAAITDYAGAVREFDDFLKTSGKSEQTNPRAFLAGLRALREKIEQKSARETDFRNVVGQYNAVIDLTNSYR
jgi:hypothetical protein